MYLLVRYYTVYTLYINCTLQLMYCGYMLHCQMVYATIVYTILHCYYVWQHVAVCSCMYGNM